MPDIDLGIIPQQNTLICPAHIAGLIEAAKVVLEIAENVPPTDGTWMDEDSDPTESPFQLNWTLPDDRARRTYGNSKDATEEGAYALAIGAMEAVGYRVLGRYYQGSGADYYMIPIGANEEDYVKLEVSGILRNGNVKGRLREKTEQVQTGDISRPGRAVVAQFSPLYLAIGAWV